VDNPASLGAVVRDRRLALGYSLGQLATKVNKTAASIRAWEKGESFPTESEADALAAALDLDSSLLEGLLAEMGVWHEEPAAEVAVVDPWTEGKKKGAKAQDSASGKVAPSADDEPETEQEPQSDTALDPDSGGSAAAVAADDVEPQVIGAVEASGREPDELPFVVSGFDSDAGIVDEDAQPEDALRDDVAVADGVVDDEPHEPGLPEIEDPAGAIDDVIDGREALETAKAILASEVPRPPAPVASSPIHEAMTEAVPVIPAAVAVAEPAHEPRPHHVASDPFDAARNSNPLIYWWDTAAGWYRTVFDPRRRWIYRVRFVLILIAFYFMFRVLAWAGSELWDALKDVLDSISFSPTDTPDVAN